MCAVKSWRIYNGNLVKVCLAGDADVPSQFLPISMAMSSNSLQLIEAKFVMVLVWKVVFID